MTASQWDNTGDILALLAARKGSDRKSRLFMVATGRRVWDLLDDERCRAALELSERAADHPVMESELDHASAAAEEAYEELFPARDEEDEDEDRMIAASIASYGSSPSIWSGQLETLVLMAAHFRVPTPDLLREVLGNPFRPVVLDPSCLIAEVRPLAQVAYDERHLPSGHLDVVRLGILADALEEAGATGEIVAHLRSPGPHVRGCWAVDLLLGKE